MIVYHGSDVVVEHPDTAHSKELLDFGSGFYTTFIQRVYIFRLRDGQEEKLQ